MHVDARDEATFAAHGRDGVHPAVYLSTPFDSSERAAEVEANIRKIIDAIKDGSFRKLIDAKDTLGIQQGHFNLPIADLGFVLLRKINKWVRLKILFLFGEVHVAVIIDDVLAKRFPKVNR